MEHSPFTGSKSKIRLLCESETRVHVTLIDCPLPVTHMHHSLSHAGPSTVIWYAQEFETKFYCAYIIFSIYVHIYIVQQTLWINSAKIVIKPWPSQHVHSHSHNSLENSQNIHKRITKCKAGPTRTIDGVSLFYAINF